MNIEDSVVSTLGDMGRQVAEYYRGSTVVFDFSHSTNDGILVDLIVCYPNPKRFCSCYTNLDADRDVAEELEEENLSIQDTEELAAYGAGMSFSYSKAVTSWLTSHGYYRDGTEVALEGNYEE